MPRSIGGRIFLCAAPILAALAGADVGFRDAGELGGAAWLLGVPHPTGFPLDMLVLHAASLIPIGTIAFRQNVAVALLAAGALALLGEIGLELARRAGAEARAAAVGAVVSVVALACWGTFLASALAVEVYSGALLVVALGAWLALRPGTRLPGAALAAGLALGAHVAACLALVPIAVAALVATPRGQRGRALGLAIPAWIAGVLVVAYLPLASRLDPPIDWGNPETFDALIDHLSGAHIREAFADRTFGLTGDDVASFGGQLGELVAVLPLALVGLFWLARRVPGLTLVLVAVGLADAVYAVAVNPMGIPDRQVGHVAAAVCATCAASGVAALLTLAWPRPVLRHAAIVAAAALAVAILLAAARDPARSGHAAVEIAGSGGPLAALPARTVLLCDTDDACAGALFAIHVERIRPDVRAQPATMLPPAELIALVSTDEPPRPVVFDTDRTIERAGAPIAVIAAPVPPYLASSTSGLAPPVRDSVTTLDRQRVARLSGAPVSTLAREAWAQAYDSAGKGALGAGSPERAIRAFARALRLDPSRSVGWSNLGVALARSGDARGAIDATRRAVETDPSRPTAWANLARYTAATGDHRRAREVLDAAARAGVEDPRLDQLREQLRR